MTLITRIKTIARRDVLIGLLNFTWIAPLALVTRETIRFLRFEPPTVGGTQFPLGTTATLPKLPSYIESGQVWLNQDAAGYYAVDAICPHLGCTVRLQADGQQYNCPCHGSRFALDGAVQNGPATKPLTFLKLYWGTNNQLTVDRSQQVDTSFRLF